MNIDSKESLETKFVDAYDAGNILLASANAQALYELANGRSVQAAILSVLGFISCVSGRLASRKAGEALHQNGYLPDTRSTSHKATPLDYLPGAAYAVCVQSNANMLIGNVEASTPRTIGGIVTALIGAGVVLKINTARQSYLSRKNDMQEAID